MLSLPYTLPLLPLVVSFISLPARLEAVAAVSNRTIDDVFGDSVTGLKPVFLPGLSGIWEGEDCPLCLITPDKTKTFKQTYTAATYKPELGAISIGLNFRGTAIYVFFTLANTVDGDGITTLTECNFTIDGEHAGYYRHDPTPDTSFLYQVPVFKSENLQNADHLLNISTSGLDHQTSTNFDYAIYTFDESGSYFVEEPQNPPSKPSSPRGTIMALGVGGVALVILALLFILYRRQKRIDKSKLRAITAKPGPGTTVAAATPFMVTTNHQRPNTAAQNPKFPPNGYLNFFRISRVGAKVNSLERRGDGTRHVVENKNPARHRRRGKEQGRNTGRTNGPTTRDRPPVTGNGPTDVGRITLSAEGRRQGQRPREVDLERQLREVQEEMRELREQINNPRSWDSLAGAVQMREMQEHIMYLQNLQSSAGPPPDYTTVVTERRVEGV